MRTQVNILNISNTEEKLSQIENPGRESLMDYLGTEDGKREITKVRRLSLRTLRVLNKESVKRGYNRNLYVEKYEDTLKEVINESPGVSWRGLSTGIRLVPLMTHQHKGGVICEPHIRCLISTDVDGNWNKVDGYLDVPMEMFTQLDCVLVGDGDESDD